MTTPSHLPHQPQTIVSLERDLRGLGLQRGDVILVHSSLSALGWVCGGATTVVHALLAALGPRGTLVVPAHTSDNRDPSRWKPPVPESWWPIIREHLPGFDASLTSSTGVGVIAERVRTWPGAIRSDHPQTSFAALGPRARELLHDHRLESQLGEASPLARLEEADARILFLGVGFERCTAFHLAECRVPAPALRRNACAVMTPAGRQWVTYTGVALDDSDFAQLGQDFESQTGLVTTGKVGMATCRLLPLRDAVDFALKWFLTHRR